jgi:hypothetical protein
MFDRPMLIAIGIGIASGLFPALCELILMSSVSIVFSRWFSLLQMLIFFLTFCIAMVGFIPALTLMLFPRTRRIAGLVWIACVFTLLFSAPGVVSSYLVRKYGFEQMAERTKPLIAAIKKFEQQEGRAPNGLEELVPKYLFAVPWTGIGAYPKYQYEKLEKDTDPWELRVDCGQGLLNWDEFYYRPSEKYGKRYGGWVEPMGTWAYFHE